MKEIFMAVLIGLATIGVLVMLIAVMLPSNRPFQHFNVLKAGFFLATLSLILAVPYLYIFECCE